MRVSDAQHKSVLDAAHQAALEAEQFLAANGSSGTTSGSEAEDENFDSENILDVVYEIVAGLSADRREAEIGDEVEICGLQSAVELNGQRGRIVSFLEDTQRIRVKLNDTSCYRSVKHDNLKMVQCDWVDMAEVTSIAANWNFTGDEVGKVIENWETRGGMCLNQDRTKVRFTSPSSVTVASAALASASASASASAVTSAALASASASTIELASVAAATASASSATAHEFDPENILDVLYEIMAGLSGDDREPEIGDEIVIRGLRSAAELNGRRGRIVSFSEDTQRIRVKLNDTSCYKSVKPDNLKMVQCCWVDMAEVTSIAANWNFTGDKVGKAIENCEARGGICFNQDRTKVRFASPPASVYATVASSC